MATMSAHPINVEDYVSVDPEICHGKPCFKGTRIMVSTILELVESGQSYREIRKGYPVLTPAHIRAALHFAHQVVDQGRFVPFASLAHAIPR